MRDEIVVIGGYGHVGGQICRALGAKWPGKVYAAGRSPTRAQAFANTAGGLIRALQFSADADGASKLPERTRLVVMCLDQRNTALAESCLRSGIDYIDVSASGAFCAMMERLNERNETWPAAAVLSVGLAPGLTNLLARKAVEELDETHSVDIAVMLGLGDSHGKAAIEWTVDSLHASFPVTDNGQERVVQSFSDGKRFNFGDGLGKRTAYRFPFSDQQALPRTLRAPAVSTRLCFDSRSLTVLLGWLRKTGMLAVLRRRSIRQAAVAAFAKFRRGSDACALKVEARGLKAGLAYSIEVGLQGRREAELTARVAVAIADAVCSCSGRLPGGIYHSEQLFNVRVDKAGQLFIRQVRLGEGTDSGPFEAVLDGAVCRLYERRLR